MPQVYRDTYQARDESLSPRTWSRVSPFFGMFRVWTFQTYWVNLLMHYCCPNTGSRLGTCKLLGKSRCFLILYANLKTSLRLLDLSFFLWCPTASKQFCQNLPWKDKPFHIMLQRSSLIILLRFQLALPDPRLGLKHCKTRKGCNCRWPELS